MTDGSMLTREEGSAKAAGARSAERVVHAKGCGAFGRLTITHDVSRFTRAKIFAGIGRETEMLARFSTGAGETGTAAERDVRGFALKFYTEEGNWDLVGNNTPVFFVRDPLKFPEFLQSQARDPVTHLRRPEAMWDFWSRSPESLQQLTILFSHRGAPYSPRFMNGYGGHTFSFWNESGERFWVKFHCKTLQGHRPLVCDESDGRAADPHGTYQRDLADAISRGEFPKWRLCVQIMPEADARRSPYPAFDVTRVWPQAAYPLHEVGILELNRNPASAFAQIERAAFSPSNVVPGIGFSPDKMLQARIFAYADAHRRRLGADYEALPVNAPRLKAHGYAGDAMRPHGVHSPAHAAPSPGAGSALPRVDDHEADDDFAQARALFRGFDTSQRALLFGNVAASMQGVPPGIVARQVALFGRVDADYAAGVEAGMGVQNAGFKAA